MNSLLSIYRENIFFWDTSRSNLPILKNKVNGITSFDASRYQDSLLALSGEFGLSLFDMRVQNNINLSVPFCIPHDLNYSQQATMVKWCNTDPNYCATATTNNNVTIWDIRKMVPLAELHTTTNEFYQARLPLKEITALEWVDTCNLYTSSYDGSIVHWDMENSQFTNAQSILKCSMKSNPVNAHKYPVSASSSEYSTSTTSLGSYPSTTTSVDVHSRECGTVIPAANTPIVDLKTVDGDKILSLDESFLGLHYKVDAPMTLAGYFLQSADQDIEHDSGCLSSPSQPSLQLKRQRPSKQQQPKQQQPTSPHQYQQLQQSQYKLSSKQQQQQQQQQQQPNQSRRPFEQQKLQCNHSKRPSQQQSKLPSDLPERQNSIPVRSSARPHYYTKLLNQQQPQPHHQRQESDDLFFSPQPATYKFPSPSNTSLTTSTKSSPSSPSTQNTSYNTSTTRQSDSMFSKSDVSLATSPMNKQHMFGPRVYSFTDALNSTDGVSSKDAGSRSSFGFSFIGSNRSSGIVISDGEGADSLIEFNKSSGSGKAGEAGGSASLTMDDIIRQLASVKVVNDRLYI
ncbi:unnamed protein product [Ambrosiozyma monospora]|uniref:Unnamed protein product n=1 Tax=Ambrosiozyma monospora TaxID=43982 RepID=A0A9W6Z1Z2_AMBMO|nr:unnamed protein product [Ambrosiozyma monospora]